MTVKEHHYNAYSSFSGMIRRFGVSRLVEAFDFTSRIANVKQPCHGLTSTNDLCMQHGNATVGRTSGAPVHWALKLPSQEAAKVWAKGCKPHTLYSAMQGCPERPKPRWKCLEGCESRTARIIILGNPQKRDPYFKKHPYSL